MLLSGRSWIGTLDGQMHGAIGVDHAAALEREEGAPLAEIASRRGALAAFLLDRADEARTLLG